VQEPQLVEEVLVVVVELVVRVVQPHKVDRVDLEKLRV
tara:strand:+ start:505 stop:618 length:114 start_codon:yes stop_codon:yes gene_type:complete